MGAKMDYGTGAARTVEAESVITPRFISHQIWLSIKKIWTGIQYNRGTIQTLVLLHLPPRPPPPTSFFIHVSITVSSSHPPHPLCSMELDGSGPRHLR